MLSVKDFERKEEERKKKEAEEAAKLPQVEKKPKYTRDGTRIYCANPGCTKIHFTLEENDAEEFPCHFHSAAKPMFHDIKKYWPCCDDGNGKMVAYDWDDFKKLPTCQKGKHQIKYV